MHVHEGQPCRDLNEDVLETVRMPRRGRIEGILGKRAMLFAYVFEGARAELGLYVQLVVLLPGVEVAHNVDVVALVCAHTASHGP